MEEQRYDDKLLSQYLLGSLPEAETESCDELSFIDDEFAARLEAVEDDLIDAYVHGELDARELAQFESHYLASPRRREKVIFARSFQPFVEKRLTPNAAGIAMAETQVQEFRVAEPEPVNRAAAEIVPRQRSMLNWLTVPNLRFQRGLAAAAMVLLLAGGWLVFETLRLRGQIEQGQAERVSLQQRGIELQAQLNKQQSTGAKDAEQLIEELKHIQEKLAQLERQLAQQRIGEQQQKALPPVFSINLPPSAQQQEEPNIIAFNLEPPTRNADKVLIIRTGTDYVALQIELEPGDDYPAYRAELRTQTGNQIVWSSRRLIARNEGRIIDVSIRAARLITRAYILQLKGIATDGSATDAGNYTFRVVKQ